MLLATALAGTLCLSADSAVNEITKMRDAGIPLPVAKEAIRATSYTPAEQVWLTGAAEIMYIPGAVDDESKKGMLVLNCGNSENWRTPRTYISVEIYGI